MKNIDVKKINVLEGPWIDSEYHKLVYPRIEQSKISSFRQQTLPITQLHNDTYWGELRSVHRIDIAIPDSRHWFLDDNDFDLYVKRLSSVEFPVFCIFESPFNTELSIDFEVFVKKLFERVSKLVAAIKEKHPATIILSPAIGVVKEDHKNQYLDFFIQHRNLFDGYAVHCCNDMTEHVLGQLSSFLNQVMNILPKPLWITKWAVPCYDAKIINTHTMGPEIFKPYTSGAAIQRLHRSFFLIESIALAGSQWFYVGLGRDAYRPRRVPGPHEFWNACSTPAVSEEYSHSWKYWHFLGMSTSEGQLKTAFLDSFLKFVVNHN